MFRLWFEGRGAVGSGPLQGLQQAHQARPEYDAEGRSRLRTRFHTAYQRGKLHTTYSQLFSLFP